MLCTCCQKIRPCHISYSKDQGNHLCLWKHHPDFATLIESALNGCELCTLFRPFVEYAQRRRRGEVQTTQSDCTDSDGSGFTYDDPFHTETVYSSEEEVSYSGYGTEDTDSEVGDKDESNDSNSDGEKGQDRFKNEDDDEETGSQASEMSSHSEKGRKNGEILRWLLLNRGAATGPEQLWIRGTSSNSDTLDTQTQSYGSVCLLSLTAGSADHDFTFFNSTYCLDGVMYDSHISLAIAAPSLWSCRCDLLKIRAGRKRPMRALRPNFEMFQRRGTSVYNLEPFLNDTNVPHPEKLDPPIYGRDIVEDPASPDVFSIIHEWMFNCNYWHPNCKSIQEEKVPFPTRVIDVGKSDDPAARIYTPAPGENLESTDYVILSHCWGPDASAITKLLKGNLEAMHRGLPVLELSQVFKDAIRIVQGLSIRYLWIDALCIVQDSPEDWAIESAKMDQYYKNSHLTISGLASPSAKHGLLWRRDSDEKAVRINSDRGEVFLRLILDDSVSLMRSDLHSSASDDRPQIEYMPLSKRAWTFQERVLSRRIVHYCQQQMVWQCKTCMLSEDGQYHLKPTEPVTTRLIDFVDLQAPKVVSNPRGPFSTTGRVKWHVLVSEYTSRSLTFPSDKLPALSGLAREVALLTGDRYLAGLWLGRLRDDLLWSPRKDLDEELDEEERERRPVGSRLDNGSPSWSWASLDAPITNNLEYSGICRRVPREYDIRFLHASTVPATSDRFGRVLKGSIVVRAFCHAYFGKSTFFKKKKKKGKKKSEPAGQLLSPDSRDVDTQSVSSAGQSSNGEEGEEHEDEEDGHRWDDFQHLDIDTKNYDWLSTPHIILCFGECVDDWSGANPEWTTEKEKDGYQEFLLLKFVDRVAISKHGVGPSRMLEGEKEAGGWRERYVRVGKASTDDGQLNRLSIKEKRGWERKVVELI